MPVPIGCGTLLSGVDFSRTTQSHTVTRTIPDTGISTGESFPVTLALGLQDIGDGGTNAGDITVITALITVAAGDSITTGGTSVSLTAGNLRNVAGAIATGTAITVDYVGNQTLTVRAGGILVGSADALTLTNGLRDTNASGGVSGDDITIISGAVKILAGVAATGATAVTFEATAALASGDQFTIQYLGRDASLRVPPTGVVEGEFYTLGLSTGGFPTGGLPLQDTNGDGALNGADFTASISGLAAPGASTVTNTNIGLSTGVAGQDAASGITATDTITLVHTGDDVGRGTTRTQITVTYLGVVDLVGVVGSVGTETPLRFRETGRDTGVFTASVVAGDSSVNAADQPNLNFNPTLAVGDVGFNTGARPSLAMQDGGRINVIYRDKSPVRTVQVNVSAEAEPPSFSEISPSGAATVNDLKAVLRADVTDNLAGVNSSKGNAGSIDFVRRNTAGNIIQRSVIVVDNIPIPISSADISVAETFAGSGVFLVQYNIENLQPIADAITADAQIQAVITWEMIAGDTAGNSSGSGVRTLNVDNARPTVASAGISAGRTFNPATQNLEASRTTIQVEFDGLMDGTSFQTSDFLINTGAGTFEPTAVSFFNTGDLRRSVFLTVPALAPDAAPRVEIVGEVLDDGGNAILVGTTGDAVDLIAPALTVTIVNNHTQGDVTLNVVSDEQIIATTPARNFFLCVTEAGGSLDCDDANFSLTPSTTTTVIRDRQEWRFDLRGLALGRYNVRMTGRDAAGNEGAAGVLANVSTAGAAVSFEIDTALPAPVSTNPVGAATATEREPFVIEIDWTSEGPPGTADYVGDTHSSVTLTKAVLDAGTANERDVLAQSSTRLNRRFSITVTNIGVGAHTLTFNGQDEVGNTRAADETLTFTVEPRPAFDLTLTPGLNLVSIPGNPTNPDINAVFSGINEVNLVFTREGDQWLSALRTGTGDLVPLSSAPLATIDARHAYWVRSDATVTVSIDIPTQGAQQILPTIPVVGGQWNLVPVVSILPLGSGVDEVQQGTKLTGDAYLSTNWSRAFTFDRGQWFSVRKGAVPQCDNPGAAGGTGVCNTSGGLPAGQAFTVSTTDLTDGVQIGRGYWVFFTANDTLVP